MFVQSGFNGRCFKIKCKDSTHAKKLMGEMKAALKNADFVRGSNNDEVMVASVYNSNDIKKVFKCLESVAGSNASNISKAADKYKQFQKNPSQPKIDVIL